MVTRCLDEGVIIKGKSCCEDLCLSGSSFTSGLGAVLNPVKLNHAAGGSSSGSAALVAAGEVDLALTCDQGLFIFLSLFIIYFYLFNFFYYYLFIICFIILFFLIVFYLIDFSIYFNVIINLSLFVIIN